MPAAWPPPPKRSNPPCAWISAAWNSPRPSCCFRVVSVSARNTPASPAFPIATPAASCSRAPRSTPRLGNPPHRVFETHSGMLNAIGLQNPGVDHVVEQILPAAGLFARRASSPTSPARRSRNTRRSPGASMTSRIDAIEINISCPNVKEGGVAFGNYPGDVGASGRGLPQGHPASRSSPSSRPIRPTSRRTRAAASRPDRMPSR